MTAPEELKEYHYRIGHTETSAMLTAAMAERMGAKPVDVPLDDDDENAPQKGDESPRLSSYMKENEAGLTNADNEAAAAKARTSRNKRG